MAITGNQKAYMPALSGIGRSGAIRSGAFPKTVFISIGGVPLPPLGADPTTRVGVLLDSLTITDNLDEAANRCTLRLTNAVPVQGKEIILTMGSRNNLDRLFAGHIVDTTQVYVGKPANVQTDVAAVDYTWQLGFALVTERYTNLSASVIAQLLVTTYGAPNGFSPIPITPGLPVLNEITFTDEPLVDCLTRLARRIGGYWYVDYQKGVHLFLEDTSRPAPTALTPTHPTFNNFTHEIDSSQTLTRVYVEGRGTRVLTAVALGETRLPVEAVDMFTVAPDVFLKVSFQGSDGGAQHLNYSGVVAGGQGAIIGPGVTPASPPTVAAAPGSGIEVGAHDYAYTWVTASGETKPSPMGSVTHTAAPAAPLVATTATNEPSSSVNELTSGAWKPGDTVEWAYSWSPSTMPAGTTLSPPVARTAVVASSWWNSPGHSAQGMRVAIVYSPDPTVKWVYIWHRVNGGVWRCWGTGYGPNGYQNFPGTPPNTIYWFDAPGTYSSVETLPVGGTPSQRSTIEGVAVGPAIVTSRRIYRTVANGAQLKLQQTIANNTATSGVIDSTPDASLGANAPATDTSALPQPVGTVLPHAPNIQVTSTAGFDPAGGWAVIGNGEQVIRYNNLPGGNYLGLIPMSGPGSVVAPVEYGATVTAAPMLTGIPASGPRSLSTRALVAGDELYLVVQVDDVPRQTELKAAVGWSGIREEWIQDRRLSIGEARARGQATLALRPFGTRSIAYTCRDLTTAAGKTITVNLPAPTNVVGLFKIQQVTISNFRPHPEQPPTFAVQASSVRFSFEDLLRSIKTKE